MDKEKLKVKMNQYVAFLRGINVSGHHKVPMAELRTVMEKWNFHNITTILNSGNIIFNSENNDLNKLENYLSANLEKTFGFPVPTVIRKSDMIYELFHKAPFKDIVVTKDIRLYVSFLMNETNTNIQLPWTSENKAYQIINISDKMVLSVLDISVTKTTKGMEALEKLFGKNVTTRNWNTIERIANKLEMNH